MQNNDRQVRELCARIIEEKDPHKLSELIAELDTVLAEREEKLRGTPRQD